MMMVLTGLSLAEQVQIRTVKYANFDHGIGVPRQGATSLKEKPVLVYRSLPY